MIKGAFEIASEWSNSSAPKWADEILAGKILYPYEAKIRMIAVGNADLRKIKTSLSFIKDKNNFGMYFQRNPGNHEQPISVQDYTIILQELQATTQTVSAEIVPEKKRQRPMVEEHGHFDLRNVIVELGKLKGMEESISEYSFDHFKLDVIWKRSRVRASPDYAFEIHMGGDLWKDFVSLKHAYDRFGCNVILVGQRDDKVMVEQLLPGAFHEMKDKFRFILLEDILRLHRAMKESRELETSLGFSF